MGLKEESAATCGYNEEENSFVSNVVESFQKRK
jgi:hypothetical protein